ncbi:MAG: general secretion pathway protein GspK [Alphaproteobacteria bacterium]|nr:general secretion pathway protein GspK [Alphaproteobacteria bacterium]
MWAITLLSLMAAATQALTVTSYRSETHAMIDARAEADLDAAVVAAVLGVSDLRPERRWRADGTATDFSFDGFAMQVSAQDELGRIDLNVSSGALITQLLLGAGLAPDEAGKLADGIVYWRSKTGLQNLRGATDDEYRAAHLTYLPRHGPFQTVDEVKLVLGMTPKLFAAIRPALTVYSKRPSFDSSVAPREALAALYPGDPGKVEQIVRARSGDPNASMQLGFSPAAAATLAAPSGRAFSIEARLTVGRRTFARSAVVELTSSKQRPYFVLAWH